jgi:hydrogenase nickel incorporation protein HypB
MSAFDFDMEQVIANIRLRNKNCEIFPVSAKTGEGFAAWVDWLSRKVTEWNTG